MKIESDHAILDVKKGRGALIKAVGGRGTSYKITGNVVPVTIRGYVDEAWGRDDGISREFELVVTDVKCHKIRKAPKL